MELSDEAGVETSGAFLTPRLSRVVSAAMSQNKPQSRLLMRRSTNLMPPPRPLSVLNSQSSTSKFQRCSIFKPLESPARTHEVKKCLFEGSENDNDERCASILGQPLQNARPYAGITPVQVHSNPLSVNNDGKMPNKRRSLLGKRGSSFNFPKPMMPLFKPPARPLFSSSPNSDEATNQDKKSNSCDTFDSSHPFGNVRPSCGDETFMTKDVCELDMWSVFKPKNPPRRSAFVSPQSAPLIKSNREVSSNNPSLALLNSLKTTTPMKSPVTKKKSPVINNLNALTQEMVNESALSLLRVSPPQLEALVSDHDSTSSFIFNESTINTGAKENNLLSASKPPSLAVIQEGESAEGNLIDFSGGECDLGVNCQEAEGGTDDEEEEEEEESPISTVIDLMTQLSDLKEQTTALDRQYNAKREELDRQHNAKREELDRQYNAKWEELQERMEPLAISHNRQIQNSIKVVQSSVCSRRKNKARVVCSKVKKGHRMFSPSVVTPTPSGGRRTKAASVYTRLRASYSVLRTPEESVVKKKQLRKSACYTPHSLTLCVGGQLNDIFGSN